MRVIFLIFAILSYVVFFATFLILIAFVAALPILPRTVDTGGAAVAPVIAAVIDLALVLLFAFQHSVMARPAFKAAWTRIVPPPVERSVYVLAASAALLVLMAFWRPIPAVIWSVENGLGAGILWALFVAGWLIVLLSTFLISHFELFGLTQAWRNLRGRMAAPAVLRQPLFYRLVRHPLYSGFFLAFWATPLMTAGHLLLAVALSVFMLVAIRLEERDLVDVFGEDYLRYRTTAGMLVPKLRRRT
jgi:protein-S-isoprenylcysteine O-methyltransferase Ste14